MKFFNQINKEEKNKSLEFTWQPRKINKHSETIEDMSIIQAPYMDFVVTKTGYLISMIEISGINLELLNDEEQTYVFDTYNAFLMNTLGDNSSETQQYLDMTMPVDFDRYILSYKKRYLLEENPARKKLIASYIYDLQEKIRHNEMSTKRHILVIKEKIKESSLLALENSASELNAKILTYQNRLEDDFESYDVQAKKIYADEIQIILKHLINFNGN
ncbi:TrsD/TraD family conjugative transfer protein [Aerococcus urinaeequi]|uniref:TrsD/TraD family conjugative transfer protein n=1 Tax=Aerococcus urinaeequi TaxID=51665 RepID=UPI003EC5E1F0